MPDFMDEVRVHVDFNDVDVDGRFFALPEDAERPLVLGLPVALWDAEGNSARGRVVEVGQQGRAFVEMIAGTWQSAEAAADRERLTFEELSDLAARYAPRLAASGEPFKLHRASSGAVAQAVGPLPPSQSQGAVLSSV
jgi:hypothetical protein